jgi:DNA-binding PadR family transcriptional regulator
MIITKLLVLGCINRREQAHGYEVYRDLVEWRADTWASIKPGSIYHAIVSLEKDQLIEALPSERGERGGSRTQYKLTTKGLEALHLGVVEALGSLEMDEYAAGLAFMSLVSKEELLALARKRLAKLKEIQTFMQSLPSEEMPSSPEKQAALVQYWTGFFNFNVVHAENFLAALEPQERKTDE